MRKTIVVSVAAFLSLIASMALAQGTYTQIDVPNSYGTACDGINSGGDIVGVYVDVVGTYHGFLFSGGTYTTIDYPGAPGTQLNGINDAGEIVGQTSSSPDVGFLYDIATQTFSTIKFPGSTSTYPVAINNTGAIVGTFSDSFNTEHGFELSGSAYREVQPAAGDNSHVHGVTGSGVLAGYVLVGNTAHNFLFKHGEYRKLTIVNAPSAAVFGINRAGTAVVGQYEPASGPISGFLYKNTILQQVLFPGSTITFANGVNDNGKTVGIFNDQGGFFHGLLWTPPVDAKK